MSVSQGGALGCWHLRVFPSRGVSNGSGFLKKMVFLGILWGFRFFLGVSLGCFLGVRFSWVFLVFQGDRSFFLGFLGLVFGCDVAWVELTVWCWMGLGSSGFGQKKNDTNYTRLQRFHITRRIERAESCLFAIVGLFFRLQQTANPTRTAVSLCCLPYIDHRNATKQVLWRTLLVQFNNL